MDKPKSIDRKPRATAVLKGLAPDHQQDLFEYMEGVGDEKGHSYAKCLTWLAASGVKSSNSQLSNWRDWYWRRLRFQWCRELTVQMLEDDRIAGQKYTDEDIERKGNRTFNLLAIKTFDDKAWARHQTLAVRRQAVAAIERKLEFEIEKYQNQRAETKEVESDPKMTPEEKEERIRQIMGTE
jgi:hypothetical protein